MLLRQRTLFRKLSPFQFQFLRVFPNSAYKMSTTSALYTSQSLQAADAPTYASLKGRLDPGLLQSLQEMNYNFMTPVQSKVMAELPTMQSDWYVLPAPN